MLPMKPTKAGIAVLCTLLLALLGGCSILAGNHPTTESRIMTSAEQEYWADRRERQDKAAEWRRETQRQSSERYARYFY